jgi:hypothetical protein
MQLSFLSNSDRWSDQSNSTELHVPLGDKKLKEVYDASQYTGVPAMRNYRTMGHIDRHRINMTAKYIQKNIVGPKVEELNRQTTRKSQDLKLDLVEVASDAIKRNGITSSEAFDLCSVDLFF